MLGEWEKCAFYDAEERTCTILTELFCLCEDKPCKFRKTATEKYAAQKKSIMRIRSLPEEQRMHLVNKYHLDLSDDMTYTGEAKEKKVLDD